MNTLKTIIFFGILILSVQIFGQLPKDINQNPLSEEQLHALREIPELPVNKSISLKSGSELPDVLDNSKTIFFPPIQDQWDWSCGQQSGVAYVFTYEMNCALGSDASLPENQFPTHFTWNYLNRSNSQIGASYLDSWKIIRDFGHPSKTTFDPENNNLLWMDGYDNYKTAMTNRIEDVYSIKVNTVEGLIKLKNWLLNHMGEDGYGGVANYYGTSDFYHFLPSDSPEPGMQVVTRMYSTAVHALTIVGYNDNIKYDFNGDGKYTNDEDINNDGIVDIRDWEIGGFIVANSYSADWGNEGFTFVMYKLMAETPEVGGFWNNTVNLIKVKTDYEPTLTVKAKISYTSRHRLKVMVGMANDTAATEPEIIKEFPILNYQGGPNYMQGISNTLGKSLEFGLDISQLYSQANENDFVKFFLIVHENDVNNWADGEITSFSIIDKDSGNETSADLEEPFTLNNGENVISLVKPLNNNVQFKITNHDLPITQTGEDYEIQLNVQGGVPPYQWEIVQEPYIHEIVKDKFDRETNEYIGFNANSNGSYKIDLDFDFPYFGNTYNTIYVTTNGTLLFDEELFMYPYMFFRDYALSSRKAIVVFGANDQMTDYYHNAWLQRYGEDSIQIMWHLAHQYLATGDFKYRAMLYKDGTIEFNFNDFNNLGIPYISGISNGTGHEFVKSTISNKSYLEDSTIVRFNPPEIFYPEITIDENGLIKGTAPLEPREVKINVKVTDFTGAYDLKEFNYRTWPLSLNENPSSRMKFEVYPNPSSDYISLSSELFIDKEIHLEIYNSMGQNVFSQIINPHALEHQIHLKDEIFSPGIYFIKATGNNVTIENKFIKK